MIEKIHNFRPDTGEYINSGVLEFEPIMGEPMIPAHATMLEPLETKEGFTVNFINGSWEYMAIPKNKPPQPNLYSVFDESTWSWIEDEQLKASYELKIKIQEAKEYLANTDYKMLPNYVPKANEDIEAIIVKRNETREFIRSAENN